MLNKNNNLSTIAFLKRKKENQEKKKNNSIVIIKLKTCERGRNLQFVFSMKGGSYSINLSSPFFFPFYVCVVVYA